MSGQPYLKWLYEDHLAKPLPDENFWDAAVRRLELKIVCNEDVLAHWPNTGSLIVVSNHPFGVLDGVVICHLVARVREDFRVLTNSVLMRAKEVREFLLPIDFTESEEAVQTNIQSRAAAKKHLMNAGCLIVFPAGGVSTTPTPWHKRAIDAEWKTYTGRLIAQAKAPVAPVFFAGQNSRIFQIASHISMTLRLSLLFKEVHDRIGSDLHIRIGEPVPFEKLPATGDRQYFMRHLREMTYRLGEGVPESKKSRIRRPRRAPESAQARSRRKPATR